MPTVYILGAGASAGYEGSYIGERCPSTQNFFEVASRMLDIDSRGETAPGFSQMTCLQLTKFLRNYYNTNMRELDKAGLNMEDVLTFLDLELEYSDSLEEIAFLSIARQEFLNLMAFTFARVLNGAPCKHHAAIAASLRPGDTVISFNYDLLMDQAMKSKCPRWSESTGYGMPATMVMGRKSRAPAAGPCTGSGILLLKLHGSFNWLTCRDCESFYLLENYTIENNKFMNEKCRRETGEPPEHRLERLIIPPTVKKDVHGKIMQKIWREAFKALGAARKIVIIGYSLPPTDFFVKRLLYRSLAFNSVIEEIEIVDRNNGREPNHLLERFKLMVGSREKPVRYVTRKKSIAEYARSLES